MTLKLQFLLCAMALCAWEGAGGCHFTEISNNTDSGLKLLFIPHNN